MERPQYFCSTLCSTEIASYLLTGSFADIVDLICDHATYAANDIKYHRDIIFVEFDDGSEIYFHGNTFQLVFDVCKHEEII